MGRHYTQFTGNDCYSVRGGVLHHGKFGHEKARYDRLGFTLPSRTTLTESLSIACGDFEGSVLSLDLVMFCQNMIEAVRSWYGRKEHDPLVQANLPNLVRFRPEGIQSHAWGVPIIA